ncbi:inositol monophosphatase family protein [Streptomyces sp. WAC 06783]|uniref:inositol monophosphatase family protein n=1 Tax=Streptomyces sp. WAC 06783 TaxID=2203211 RepID=UPI001C8CA496|nr:inositol monophosphatase family protein [Streptomyces sp. WAC 06783]
MTEPTGKTTMKDLLTGLGRYVRAELMAYADRGPVRQVHGDSPGGDAQFDVDEVAERAVLDHLRAHAHVPLAVYTEDGSLVELAPDPEYVLVVDPIDGTRPTSAGLEMGMVSIAAAPLTSPAPTLDDVTAAHLLEIKSGAWIHGDDDEGLSYGGFPHALPRLSRTTDPAKMFWSIEFNGHPMHLMTAAYGHLVDRSANTGGVFVFNSATFSISRIITGQLDAYVDIGNRVLRDHPGTEAAFLAAGRGSILHLFPYDIAAAVYLAKRSGVTITDAYGGDLGTTALLDLDPMNQKSCVAAATPQLHKELLGAIRWDIPGAAPTTSGGTR